MIVPVEFNGRLTKEQRSVIGHELSVSKDATVTLPTRAVHEFFIHFGDRKTNDGIVWPPIKQSSQLLRKTNGS